MRLLILALAVMVSGCVTDPPEVKKCESALLAKLKSPATYKRISVSDMLISERKMRYQSVDIKYDAENSYGALIRDTESCFYPVELSGKIRTDLPGDIGDAVNGRGYFSPSAKLPTVEQHEQQVSDDVNAIMANYDAANVDLSEPDNMDSLPDNTGL